MIRIIGQHIVVEGPDAAWQSEAIDLGRDSGVICAVTVIATDNFSVFPELWGANQRSQGFTLLASAEEEIGGVGQSIVVKAAPVGVRYVQLRFGPGEMAGTRMVVAATLESYRA